MDNGRQLLTDQITLCNRLTVEDALKQTESCTHAIVSGFLGRCHEADRKYRQIPGPKRQHIGVWGVCHNTTENFL